MHILEYSGMLMKSSFVMSAICAVVSHKRFERYLLVRAPGFLSFLPVLKGCHWEGSSVVDSAAAQKDERGSEGGRMAMDPTLASEVLETMSCDPLPTCSQCLPFQKGVCLLESSLYIILRPGFLTINCIYTRPPSLILKSTEHLTLGAKVITTPYIFGST